MSIDNYPNNFYYDDSSNDYSDSKAMYEEDECDDKHRWHDDHKCDDDHRCDDKHRCHERHCREIRLASSIIPFASGGPVTLNVIQPNTINVNESAIAFGNNATPLTLNVPSGTITLPLGGTVNMAFTMPRNGIIRSLAADFTLSTLPGITAGAVLIRAQLYRSFPPSITFTAIPGTEVTLAPPITGASIIGSVSTGIRRNINIPVRRQTRLMLVFSAIAQGTTTVAPNPIIGYASAGLGIL